MTIRAGQRITADLLNSLASMPQPADKTTHTVTAAVDTALTNLWTIPANDASAGIIYRLKFFGIGTWGSTAQALTMNAMIDGVVTMAGGNVGRIAAATFSVNTPIYIEGEIVLSIVSIGASGTYTIGQRVTVTARAENLPGTAASNTITTLNLNSSAGATTAIDTTVSHTFAMAAKWGATTGAPTVSGIQSYLERLEAA